MNTIDVDEIIQKAIQELKLSGLLKDKQQTAFQKTERLLYNYKNFEESISLKENFIKFIQEGGIQQKSKSVVFFNTGSSGESKTDDDKAEEQIQTLQTSIVITKRYISVIDNALDRISEDKYFCVIRMKYFDDKTREEIAETLEVDVRTVSRHKNRLINILSTYLFSDEVIKEIFM